ncbi:zinc finger MYM-type protein 5-like [Daktulosphaira vitifoliae]|uniref:zinc finger MYM-type protein 5-like n=1 Tax=Daktulosphaira vitifoliae TaxID=58002 RepID=UPI0021AA879C|nr:zinc finger MYM-type protein 5-like [Daktulosphaira vitifoliae]
MSPRKYKSGAFKRKIQNIKKEGEAKIPKLSNYFHPIENTELEPKMNKEIDTNADELFDMNTNEKMLTEFEINKDPVLWSKMSEAVLEECIKLGPEYFQNKDNGFSASMRKYNNQKRYFSSKLFIRTLVNGEKHIRLWFMYSESTGNVFCFVCMFFNDNSSVLNPFVKNGFSNWK